ncbi:MULTISPECIES: hypothetical protein [Thermogemmatispora]|uniref:Uncharacterized protein n=2 Tax=Thermogemmatispora TaxID=768669 RepID=A0A328VHY8_9CHLR|nr:MULTISPECIES: hypothetical protein [Thermogemmatispora]RAQ95273.1 hypothetical protein A4R35_06980 [Thermogemmatispora tikiterensis]GER81641.1 hypothetical protein KTAU_02790 [Thermogemmatispora aurantia]
MRGKLRDKRVDMKRSRFKFKRERERELEGRRRLVKRDYRDLDEWLDEEMLDLSDEEEQFDEEEATR